MERLSDLLDDYFRDVFEKHTRGAEKGGLSGKGVAIIALGGYGRQEQCIHSDIDLLILFENQIPGGVDTFFRELVYPLWDARFEVGYAVRTVEESISIAFERFDVLTTVLDARFVCGAFPVYARFMEKFKAVLQKQPIKSHVANLLEQGEKRHADFGDATYLLEPHLKSGYGGLRDYHTILWYAKIKGGIEKRRDLEYYGFLSHQEFARLESTLGFIWDIRNWLHYMTNRKCDQLHFEHQLQIAQLLGFTNRKGQRGVEVFMGKLHNKMAFIKHINQVVSEDILAGGRFRDKPEIFPGRADMAPGLVVSGNRLNFAGTVHVICTPSLLLRIFYESGEKKIPLSFEAQRIVTEFVHLVDKNFRKNPENVAMFQKILFFSYWEFNVLNVMLSTGILQRFIPEFATIVNKIQFNEYHLFPVDKHAVRCVQIINSFRRNRGSRVKNFYSTVYRDVKSKKTLLTGALLHDIGKGIPGGGHSAKGARIVQKTLRRMDYSASEVADITFLIRHHLFLVKTATRRDISDEETAVFCASRIKTMKRLRMLYLLSVADSMATGPKAWNSWTETLLKDLFFKTLNIMKHGELASSKSSRLIEQKKDKILKRKKSEWGEADPVAYLESMSRRYLLYTPVTDIIQHIDLYRHLGKKAFNWRITRDNDAGIRTITICGRDRPGFYSKVAGVFFLNGLDIVASEAYSWGRDAAFDIFRVMAPRDTLREDEKWEKAAHDLEQAINDDAFLENLQEKVPRLYKPSPGQILKPNRVKIDNETSSFFTIVEVYTVDFPGLLFAVTDCLYRNGADVKVAKVATKVDQVVDVFYVSALADDHKITSPEQLDRLKKNILGTLPSIDAKEILYEKD